VFVFLALLGVLAIVGVAATIVETSYKGARPIPNHRIGSL
jgi:Tfp pilus assembly protein PilE